jgi:hypothetical protein
MKNIFYHPNIGSNYFKTGFNGLKLLILGESHYCGEGCEDCGSQHYKECFSFTQNVMEEYFSYKNGEVENKRWMNTYTKFANAVFGYKLTNEELLAFWESVIFYNYVQFSTDGPRIAPRYEQFKNSEEAFLELLSIYKPDIVIGWGMRLQGNMPTSGRWGNENLLDNKNEKFYYLRIDNIEIPIYFTYHPSSSAFNKESTAYIKEVFKKVNMNK